MAISARDWKIWLILILVLMFIFLIAYGLTPEDWKNFSIVADLNNKGLEPKSVPKRNSSMGEEECRKILEEHFKKPFPSVNRTKETWFSLPWLFNDRTGEPLELDGYCRELGIAFEFQGPQHYEYMPGLHKSLAHFENQIYCDRRKKDLCLQNKVWLIIIPHHVQKQKRKEHILAALPGGQY